MHDRFHKPIGSGLIFGLEDRPPISQILCAACQHLIAMLAAVVSPAILICQSLNLPYQDTQRIVSMSLFSSGIASIVQIKSWGPIGSGLLSIQGTSFNFVTALIISGTVLKSKGVDTSAMMASLFGTLMLASCTEMIFSYFFYLANRIITPLVSGVIVMIIGLSLIQISFILIGGGYAAISNHTFGAQKNLLLAGIVLSVIVLLNCQRYLYLRSASIVVAISTGYLAAWFMQMLPNSTNALTSSPMFMIPIPLYYGLDVQWDMLFPFMLIFITTSLESIGDITATSDVSEQPVSGPIYMKRLKGGVLANGLNSFFAAVLNTFPNSCFAQNNSVIQLTGIASRYVGIAVAFMLIILGLFPQVSDFIQHIPEPVFGGATFIMFGTIAASGIRIIAKETLNRRAIMILAISLSAGLGISQQPLILQFTPVWIKNLLSSGITTGGITAIILNIILPVEEK